MLKNCFHPESSAWSLLRLKDQRPRLTQPSTCMPTYQIQTRMHPYLHSSAPRNSTHIIHKFPPLLCIHVSRLRTELTGVFGASSCAQVLQLCAALLHRLCR
jgi:hypothetical protein